MALRWYSVFAFAALSAVAVWQFSAAEAAPAKTTAKAAPPGSELMEFICTENNQYGVGLGIENQYKESGFGLEVAPADRK